jgi:hypothetical protein
MKNCKLLAILFILTLFYILFKFTELIYICMLHVWQIVMFYNSIVLHNLTVGGLCHIYTQISY